MALPEQSASEATARVTVSRTSEQDSHQRQVIVKVDGVRIAELLFGDSVTVPLAPGHHKVEVDNTWNWKTVEFDAAPGEHVKFRTVNKTGHWGWFLLSAIGVGLIFVSIEREN